MLLGYARVGTGIVLGNGFTYQIASFGADGSVRARFGRTVPVRHLEGAALERETARLRALAKKPFRGPDGKVMPRPDPAGQAQRIARSPLEYFAARDGGLQATPDGAAFTIGTTGDSTIVERFRPGKAAGRAAVDCAGRQVRAAMRDNFLALLCESTDASDREVDLRLYRVR